jgi:hypothetical protein
MSTKEIQRLVEEARSIFNATSIYEVIDLDKYAAIGVLSRLYSRVCRQEIECYWAVLERLR